MSEKTGLRNFDAVIRPDRKGIIGGEEVDVSKIPSRVALELAEMKDTIKKDDDNAFYKSIELVAKACQPSNKKITAEFLLDNTDIETLLDIVDWVLEPILKRSEESAKNPPAQASKKKKSRK